MKDYGSNRPASYPYQCFMGRWEGLCKTFSPEGEFIEGAAVHMDVYWTSENSWHLHEEFDNFYGLGKPVTFHSDITVRGKFCFGESELVKLEGAGLTPFNYVFTIWSAVSQTTVYNNHYFLDPNNRRILTHKVRDGKTNIFQIQDFVRVVTP
jgi:hypothetical protein